MEKENNPIYERNTLEFVTVALEFCTFVENAGNTGLFDFLDKAVKILPLLYLKATLLPEAEEDEDAEPELTVTEDMYESVRNRIAGLLGEKDSYLETFHPDMQYSDTPIAAPGLRRRHEPVRRHLGAHRRGRPAQLPRDLPARRPALQHPLDRVPLVPREPSVGPRDRPRGAAFLLSGHAILRSPGAGRPGPQGIGFPHSSAHVRMNVGGVRMKSIIKDAKNDCKSVTHDFAFALGWL